MFVKVCVCISYLKDNNDFCEQFPYPDSNHPTDRIPLSRQLQRKREQKPTEGGPHAQRTPDRIPKSLSLTRVSPPPAKSKIPPPPR